MLKRLLIFLIALTIFMVSIRFVQAWNKPGHIVSAAIAYKTFEKESPKTIAKIMELLEEHSSFRKMSFLILPSSKAMAQRSQEEVCGWSISDKTYNKLLIDSLKSKIARNIYKQINSIIVIKKGKLLVEEYFNGADRNQLHDASSVGKTFASAVLGIALKEGHIKDLNQTIAEFYDLKKFKNYSDKKSRVTLKHLLTMSSGFEGDDNDERSVGNEENMYLQINWVGWTLDLPMATEHTPGDKWRYFTAGIVLLGDIVNQRVPQGLKKYADKKLFKPLGITKYEWAYTPQNVPSTAGGLRLAPLDFAKFGQLFKNGGQWNEKQILPKAWVQESLLKHKETAFKGDWYGYLWWNKVYTVADRPYEVFYCSGNGGNKIFVFTDESLVVVVTASAYSTPYMHKQVDEIMTKYILPATLTP